MWDIQPSEFWGMAIRDWWWEYAARQDHAQKIVEEQERPAQFRGPFWDNLRKRHAEKMRQKNGKSSKSSG